MPPELKPRRSAFTMPDDKSSIKSYQATINHRKPSEPPSLARSNSFRHRADREGRRPVRAQHSYLSQPQLCEVTSAVMLAPDTSHMYVM
jgi:hypothetical protein